LPRKVETRLPYCGITHYVRIDHQLMKTTHINITKPNETKAWFRWSVTSSGQETDCAYSTAVETCMRPQQHN